MPILGPNGQPIADAQPKQARVPTYPEMKQILDNVTGVTIMFLQQQGAAPKLINSVGKILSQLKFNPALQGPNAVEDIISKEATALLNSIKIDLLAASVDPGATATEKPAEA